MFIFTVKLATYIKNEIHFVRFQAVKIFFLIIYKQKKKTLEKQTTQKIRIQITQKKAH